MSSGPIRNPEVGRELTVQELKTGIVVVLISDHRPEHGMTVNCLGASAEGAIFHAPRVSTTLLLFINEQGEMHDDARRRIRAYEYLGDR